MKKYASEYRIENQQRIRQHNINYRKDNKELMKKREKLYRLKNKEIIKEQQSEWFNKNKEKVLKQQKEYRTLNKGITNDRNARRRARKLNATPQWLTPKQKQEIQDIYVECSRMSKETSISHHVDHIIPLQGKTVCGLHVPWNLQILTDAENLLKSNKLI